MTPGSEAPLEVAFLLDDLGGGTGNHLLTMMRHWDRARVRARIVSHARLTARFTPPVPVEYGPERRWYDRYPLAQLRRFRHASRRLRGRRTDVLHCYFFWPIIYGRLLHGLGHVPHLVENREDLGFNWGRHEYAWLRGTRRLAGTVVCVSKAVRDVVLEREGLDPERVRVIRNGIKGPSERGDEEARSAVRDELGVDRDELLVGMVANINRAVKGAEQLLEAIPLVVREVPRARFVLFGKGNREALRRRAEELDVADLLLLPGYREDMDRCYEALDLSVLTSLSEGLSITILESMRHGLPVVATRVGGNPELVVEGVTGYLVPPVDASAFAERVTGLLRDPEERERMGGAAQERVRRHFAVEKVAERYLNLYEGLSGSGGGGDSGEERSVPRRAAPEPASRGSPSSTS